MANRFVQGIELHTSRPDAALEFYRSLLGWEFEPIPEMGYWKFADPAAGGGLMRNPAGDAASHWAPYLLVDDVAATVARASELGASVVVPTTEIPGHGWFAIVKDPTGATFGLWKGAC